MKELSPPSVNLKRLFEQETLPEEPILIVISPGADPSQELQDLANETIGHDRYHQVLQLEKYFKGLSYWVGGDPVYNFLTKPHS